MSWSGLRQPAIHWRSPSGGSRAGRKAWTSCMREDSFGGHSIVPTAFTVAAAQAAAVTTEALWKHPSLFKIANGAVIEIVSSSITWSLRGQGEIYGGRKYSTRPLQRLMGKSSICVYNQKRSFSLKQTCAAAFELFSPRVVSLLCGTVEESSFCFFNLVSTSCSPSSAQNHISWEKSAAPPGLICSSCRSSVDGPLWSTSNRAPPTNICENTPNAKRQRVKQLLIPVIWSGLLLNALWKQSPLFP